MFYFQNKFRLTQFHIKRYRVTKKLNSVVGVFIVVVAVRIVVAVVDSGGGVGAVAMVVVVMAQSLYNGL